MSFHWNLLTLNRTIHRGSERGRKRDFPPHQWRLWRKWWWWWWWWWRRLCSIARFQNLLGGRQSLKDFIETLRLRDSEYRVGQGEEILVTPILIYSFGGAGLATDLWAMMHLWLWVSSQYPCSPLLLWELAGLVHVNFLEPYLSSHECSVNISHDFMYYCYYSTCLLIL